MGLSRLSNSSHEKTKYKRLFKRYPGVVTQEELDAFFSSPNTVDLYTDIILKHTDWPLSSYSVKAGERLKSPKKIYMVDNGFMSAKAIQHSPDKGKLMENLIFTELVKRGIKPNRELFYYKTHNDREVDFVVKEGMEIKELLQVCYEIKNPDVEQREVKALVEAGDELKTKKLTVLTWDEKREVVKNGLTIRFKPLWEWLLSSH